MEEHHSGGCVAPWQLSINKSLCQTLLRNVVAYTKKEGTDDEEGGRKRFAKVLQNANFAGRRGEFLVSEHDELLVTNLSSLLPAIFNDLPESQRRVLKHSCFVVTH